MLYSKVGFVIKRKKDTIGIPRQVFVNADSNKYVTFSSATVFSKLVDALYDHEPSSEYVVSVGKTIAGRWAILEQKRQCKL